MQQQEDDNVIKVHVPDTRIYEAEDNAGHIKGSHQAGSNDKNMEKERLKEGKENAPLNETDARGTMDGDEIL